MDQYRTFYSCFYRSLLFPRKFYEINAQGEVVHYSPYNGEVLPGYMFTDTGFWDTFRSLFPFLNLMFPSVNKEMQEGLINTYKAVSYTHLLGYEKNVMFCPNWLPEETPLELLTSDVLSGS